MSGSAFSNRMISRVNAAVIRMFQVDVLFKATPISGAVAIGGVWSDSYVDVVSGVSSQSPTIRVNDVDVPGLTTGSTFVVNSKPYRIHDRHPDGSGQTVILLHEAV